MSKKAQLREKIKELEGCIEAMRAAPGEGTALAALRMVKMTPEQRSEVARKAVNVRWARYRAAKKMARKPRARKAA